MTGKKEKKRIIKASLRPWYRWHRRIGMFAGILVIILAVTGLLLSYNVALDLDKIYLSQAWLLSWYGYDANADYANEILTMDKLLLDIHTGRILGGFGELLMDFAAIALLLLSASGFYMWYKKPTPRAHAKKRKKSE